VRNRSSQVYLVPGLSKGSSDGVLLPICFAIAAASVVSLPSDFGSAVGSGVDLLIRQPKDVGTDATSKTSG